MSKFMRAFSPRVVPLCRAESNETPEAESQEATLLVLLRGLGRRRRELLDQLPDLCRGRRRRVELHEGLVRGDRGDLVARRLGGLRELELRVCVCRLELDEGFVRGDRIREAQGRPLVQIARRGARGRRRRLLDGVGAERLRKGPGRRTERLTPRRELLVLRRRLVLRDVALRLRELQAA